MLVYTQNDTSPSLQANLKDYQGNAINLAGCSVQFHMVSVDGEVTITRDATVENASTGLVQYDWQSGDTAVAGSYYVQFQITYGDGAVETYPNNTKLTLIIKPELA